MEPFGTHHPGSGAPRTGTLNFECHGVLVVFDSNELAQLSDAVEWQKLREQISQISLCWNLHHIQPSIMLRCLQPKMSRVHMLRQPKSLTCCVVHHTTLESESFYPVGTAAYSSLSYDESRTAICNLDQNLKSLPLWTSIPPVTGRLSFRFAAHSLSVYAMMWSDRTSHMQCVQVIGRPIRNRPNLLSLTISASFGA